MLYFLYSLSIGIVNECKIKITTLIVLGIMGNSMSSKQNDESLETNPLETIVSSKGGGAAKVLHL